MRLPSKIKVVILNEIQKSFGDTEVYLFGSRLEFRLKRASESLGKITAIFNWFTPGGIGMMQ